MIYLPMSWCAIVIVQEFLVQTDSAGPVCESVEHNIFNSDAVVAVPVQILIST